MSAVMLPDMLMERSDLDLHNLMEGDYVDE